MSFQDDSKHLNSYIHKILEMIKKEDRYFMYKEIEKSLGINLAQNPQIIKMLKSNSKVNVMNDGVKFIPLYNIRKVEDLRDVINQVKSKEGIEMSKLLESPVDIKPYIENLKSEEEIIILKDMDGSEIVFYNDMKFPKIKEEIKALWDSVKIPNYHDIAEEMNTAGLKKTESHVVKKSITVKKKQPKKSQRRIKITNTHVKDLDLNNLDDSD